MQALFPNPLDQLDDAQILARYDTTQRPFVRFNFISSLDGSAQLQGLSSGLGSPADARIFGLLRRLASIILVGSGTIRDEGYQGALLDEAGQRWRVSHGLSPHPALGIISHGLNISPDAPVLHDAGYPVLIFTNQPITAEVSARYPRHVELLQITELRPGQWCNTAQLVAHLQERNLGFIHAEGGPHIFGQFIAQDSVDSLCLSYSPQLVAGPGLRIAQAAESAQLRLALHGVLEEDGMLLTEYRRGADPSGSGTVGAPTS